MSRTQRSICLLGRIGFCLGKCLHYIRLRALCLLRSVREAQLMVTRTELVTVPGKPQRNGASCINVMDFTIILIKDEYTVHQTPAPPSRVQNDWQGNVPGLFLYPTPTAPPPCAAHPPPPMKTMLSSSALPALCPFLVLDAEWVPRQRMIRQRQSERRRWGQRE